MERPRLLTIIGASALVIIIALAIIVNVNRTHHTSKPASKAQSGVVSTGGGGSLTTPTPSPTTAEIGSSYPGSKSTPSTTTSTYSPSAQEQANSAPQGAAQTSQSTADQTAAKAAAEAFVKAWVGYDDTTPAAATARTNTIKTLEAPGAGLDTTHSRLADAYQADGYTQHTVTIDSISSVITGGQANGHWVAYVSGTWTTNAIMAGHSQQLTGQGMWTIELPPHSGGTQSVYNITESLPGYTADQDGN